MTDAFTPLLREICAGTCGDFGEPACWRLPELTSDCKPEDITPCDECLDALRRSALMTDARYPYRHHGPAVHGSKLIDYLISERSLREDAPELFEHEGKGVSPNAK